MQYLFVIYPDTATLDMIRCHLSRLMGERKLKVIDVARETGIHRNMVSMLYKETATRIELEAVDKLCRLFDCKVGDLFEFVDNSGQTNMGPQ